MNKELEEAKEHLEHEIKIYENNKEINELIGGELGKMQHKTYKTVLNYIENSIPKDKIRQVLKDKATNFFEGAGLFPDDTEMVEYIKVKDIEELLEEE